MSKFYKLIIGLLLAFTCNDLYAATQSVVINRLKYDLDTESMTATLTGTGASSSEIKELIIPEKVSYEGKQYSVTSIGRMAFSHSVGFTGTLTIPNSITTIGEYAFLGCKGFTGTLTIPSSVTYIDGGAFYDCTGFTTLKLCPLQIQKIGGGAFANIEFENIYCDAVTPLTTSGSAFGSWNYDNTFLHVPVEGLDAYKTTGEWKKFRFINYDKQATTITIDGLKYDIDSETKTATVIGPESTSSDIQNLTIPRNIYYDRAFYSVTSIADKAFENCNRFTGSLTIGNSVTSIGERAFYNCSGFTGSLNLGNSVTSIGQAAFQGCRGFTGSLTIGNSVTSIGQSAFQGCYGFTGSLTIPNSVTSIGESAFHSCAGFTGSLTIPNSVTSIGESAFYSCTGFTGSLTIPNSVTSIGTKAFYWCRKFETLNLFPLQIQEIGEEAFNGTEFENIYCDAVTPLTTSGTSFSKWDYDNAIVNVPAEGLYGYRTTGEWVKFKNIQPIGEIVITKSVVIDHIKYDLDTKAMTATVTGPESNPANINNLVIPDYVSYEGQQYSVISIVDEAFKYCKGLTGSLSIGNSVIYIGNDAFYDCTGFTGSLKIGESVTTIGKYAFYDCNFFNGSLTIPNSVTSIGQHAFYRCYNLKALTIGNSVTSIGDYAFYGCEYLAGSLRIPNSVTTIGSNAFYECRRLSNLIIGNSVTSIGSNAFNGCSGFTGSLTIPNSVTFIGSYAFSGCKGLTGTLTIPNLVTYIGGGAFSGCSGFTGSLIIPNSVTTISEYTFSGCSGFTGSLTIPNSVTSIGKYAFQNCTGFSGSLTIPNSVTSIDTDAFRYCSGFKTLNLCPSQIKQISGGAFYNIEFENIYCDAVTPLTTSGSAFSSWNYHYSTLHVPVEGLDKYKTTGEWKNFKNIQSIGEVVVTGITLNVQYITLIVGQTDKLTATVEPTNVTNPAITWSSNNQSIVSVAADGTITALSVGVANITATCGNVSATCQVVVKPISATSVTLNVQDMTLLVGQTDKLSATIEPANVTNPTITWSSDNTSVATVAADGTVTAMSAGVANITATCGNVSATCIVTVKGRPETPEEYVKKGNGTSCTFVVMMNLSDAELTAQGYYFAYGYTDRQGTDHIISTNQIRYCHTNREIYDDTTNDFWVLAYWKNTDGSITVSTRRHLDGRTDNGFDSGLLERYLSRSGNSVDPERWITPTAAGAQINLVPAGTTVIYVFNASGVMEYSKEYNGGVEVYEEIAGDRFPATTHIVTVISGDIKVSKKIIIR